MVIKTNGFKMPNGDIHTFIPPSPTETERGGIKAKVKTTETMEIAVDPEDGKAYAPLDDTLTQSGQAADAKATGDKILQFAIKNTASGESPLVVPDSAEEGILGFGLTGKTEQVSTTGKNLIDDNLLRILDNYKIQTNVYYVYRIEGLVTGKTYTISRNDKSINNNNNNIFGISVNQENYTKSKFLVYDGLSTSYNLKSITWTQTVGDYADIIYSFGGVASNTTQEKLTELFKTLTYVQLEESSAATPYEPYTGGKPSPSPDYPQEIKSVGKWNEDTGKYEVGVKVTGKNLFNGSVLESKYPTNDMNVYEDKTTTNLFTPVEIEPNTNYLITIDGKILQGNVYLYDNSGQKIEEHFTGKFLSNENAKYVVGSFAKTFGSVNSNIQIEYGSTNTSYEPYREPQSLTLTSDRPITKWDRLVEQDGQIGWLYQSGNVTLDGSEKWIIKMTTSNTDTFYTEIPNMYFKNSVCDKYIHKLSSWAIPNYGVYSDNGYDQKYFRPPYEGFEMDVNLWKEFLKEHPLTIVSETETTEFVPLSQEEQDNIRALASYYQTTVITTEDGMTIDLDYVADTKNFILNNLAQTNQALANTQAQLL